MFPAEIAFVVMGGLARKTFAAPKGIQIDAPRQT
jgi:hypothetical protein